MVQGLLIYGSKNITYVFNSYANHSARLALMYVPSTIQTVQCSTYMLIGATLHIYITKFHGAQSDGYHLTFVQRAVWFNITSHGPNGQVLRLCIRCMVKLGVIALLHNILCTVQL